MDEVLQKLDRNFGIRKQNYSKKKYKEKLKAAASKAPEKETAHPLECANVDTDVDSEFDSDKDISITDMKRARNWPWPIQDHENFLEMERKFLQDEDFAEDLVS